MRNSVNGLIRVGALILGACFASGAMAQAAWPNRPLKLIVGATPGGSNDFVARAISDGLARALGQPVVVDNRPGVGSSLAADAVVKSPPDGYTILVGAAASISINPALDAKWNSAQSLVPVGKLSSSPLVITASPQLGVKTVQEFVAYAKRNPGKLNYAHAGQGSLPHLGAVLFNQQSGIDLVPVPFKGGAPAIQSLMANDTQVTFATTPSVLPQIRSGRLVGLAVTMPERFSLAPELPGMKEAGLPNFKVDIWFGLFVPPGTPPDIVKKLFDATNGVLHRPEVKTALAGGGMDVATSTSSAEFAAFVNEENKVWGKLARDSGAQLE
jgi:tripartite-type tricarboxylate transporter receptor subunit TctC